MISGRRARRKPAPTTSIDPSTDATGHDAEVSPAELDGCERRDRRRRPWEAPDERDRGSHDDRGDVHLFGLAAVQKDDLAQGREHEHDAGDDPALGRRQPTLDHLPGAVGDAAV